MKKTSDTVGARSKMVPWMFVVVFAALAVWGIFFYAPTQNFDRELSKMRERYPLLDPAQGLYKKKDLLVDVTPLRDDLIAYVGNRNITIYFEFLNTGANVAVNDTAAFWPASLMKVPVAMAVMKKIQGGKWTMDNELILTNPDKNDQYGDLYEQPAGSRFTVSYLLDQMLVASDNTARSIFLRNLDQSDIEDVLSHLGLEDIFNSDQQVRAKKYSVFWRSLYAASYLNAENSERLIEIMDEPHAEQFLRQGIPTAVSFSHKIGVSNHIYSDSGIVYVPNRPYLITIMMQAPTEKEATAAMSDISKMIYDYVASY